MMIYLLTAIGLTSGGSSTVHIYTHIHKQYKKKTVQKIQNAVNTSIHITKTSTHYKTYKYTHAHITKPTHTHTHTHYKTSQNNHSTS
jgi:hypothetical protein